MCVIVYNCCVCEYIYDVWEYVIYKFYWQKSVETSWPSGLRRNVKAVVFIGVGSNPIDVNVLHLTYHFTLPNNHQT